MSYEEDVAAFKQHIIEGDVLDPGNVHHEFVSGMHGRKLDFDIIPDNSKLFREWIDIVTKSVRELFSSEKLEKIVLVSVANGTNRVVPIVADKLAKGDIFLLTEKDSPKSAKLTAEAKSKMPKLNDNFFVVLEDVGTKGTTSASVVKDLRENGATDIEVINTWQRREQLEELESISVEYHFIIKEILPTYSPEECKTSGLCAAGAKLIEHAK